MHLLYLADHEVWPPDSGIKQRLYHLAMGLARRHRVSLVAMSWGDGDDVTAFPGQERFAHVLAVPYATCRFMRERSFDPWAPRAVRLWRSMESRVPVSVRRFESPVLVETLAAMCHQDPADVVWATRSAFAEAAWRAGYRRIVLDLPDMESEILARWTAQEARRRALPLRWLELARLRAYERALPSRFPVVTVCKEEERRYFAPEDASRILVVPNGVPVLPRANPADEEPDTLLFVGTLSWPPNEDAVRFLHDAILPRLRARRPGVRMLVIGRNPSAELRALADGDRLRIDDTVDDLTEAYARSAVVVVPIRQGSGTRLKTLEALARGKAVVSTPVGSEGLELRPGIDLEEVADADAFAAACAELLADPARRRRLGDAGRDRVLARNEWRHSVAAAERAVAMCATERVGETVATPRRDGAARTPQHAARTPTPVVARAQRAGSRGEG